MFVVNSEIGSLKWGSCVTISTRNYKNIPLPLGAAYNIGSRLRQQAKPLSAVRGNDAIYEIGHKSNAARSIANVAQVHIRRIRS